MNARDHAISARDLAAYSQLIAGDYHDGNRGKVDVLAQMIDLFDRFEEVHLQSFNREVRLFADGRGECQQSYRLRVRSGKRWREMVERERIGLKRTQAGWRIVAGL